MAKQLTAEAKTFLRNSDTTFSAVSKILKVDLVTLGTYLGKKSMQKIFIQWDIVDLISKAMGVEPEEILEEKQELAKAV